MGMKKFVFTLAIVCCFFVLALLPAQADTLTLTSCHISSGCPAPGTAFGTITLTQSGTDVTVDVVLTSGNRFVETGSGGDMLVAFNDSLTGSTITNMTATLDGADITSTISGGLTGVTNQNPFMADGTGTFTAGVSCSTFASCNGGSAPDMNDLHFTVTNATVAGLETANANGNLFIADILFGAQGGTGTGPVDISVPVTSTPESPSLALFGTGLFSIAGMLRRKMRKYPNAARL